MIINLWASWCFECIEEHRVLMEAQERNNERLMIVGIDYQDTVADARGFLARYGNGGWPNLIDVEGRLAIDYGVTGVPESPIIDTADMVRYRQYGAVTRAVPEDQVPPFLADNGRIGAPAGDP